MINREVDIVKYLLENKNDVNISDIAKGMNIDYKNAHNIITRLIEKNIVKSVTFGKSNKITLINSFNHLIYEAENTRKVDILKNKNLISILDYFEKNSESKFFIILLNSYKSINDKKNSDIDLMIIVPNEDIKKNITNLVKLSPIKIKVNLISEKEFKSMKDSKKKNLVTDAIENNIILHGIEAYYNILND